MLQYKSDHAGVWFDEVDERYSTQTCSCCNRHTGPKGREGPGIREWACPECGAYHHRVIKIDVLPTFTLRLPRVARKGRGFLLQDGDVPPRECSVPHSLAAFLFALREKRRQRGTTYQTYRQKERLSQRHAYALSTTVEHRLLHYLRQRHVEKGAVDGERCLTRSLRFRNLLQHTSN